MKQKPKTRASAERISRARRLQFVAKFAQLDLTTLRRGDWMNLREDLEWFLAGVWVGPEFDFGRDEIPTVHGDIMAHPDDPPTSSDAFADEAFSQLQADTRALLYDLVDPPGKSLMLRSPVPVQMRLSVIGTRAGQKVMQLGGRTHDLFLLLVYMLLWQERRQALARCTVCGTIFYRHGNQMYCSRPCLNRLSQRSWRERHETGVIEGATPGTDSPPPAPQLNGAPLSAPVPISPPKG